MRRVGPHQVVDDGEQPLRVLVHPTQARLERGRVALRCLLEQHLAVADDVVQRRAQLVSQVGERCSIHAHDVAPGPSNAWILDRSRARSTGLVSKSSQPAARALSRSPAIACAVRAMTGMRCVAVRP